MRTFISLFFVFSLLSIANAQVASEVPPESPELVEPGNNPEVNSTLKPDINEPEAPAQDEMTLERFVEVIQAIDKNAEIRGSTMRLTIADVRVTVITDAKSNRMRAFTPIQNLDGVNQQLLYRMLQANFDSALDARYAIAKGHILSVFIHPMKELDKKQLIEGIGQVVNLVKTYGTAFSSGAMTFGGGDSRNLHRKLIDELLKKGEEI